MKQDVALSKRLSYHLRHAPHELGLTLQPGGWVNVDDLLGALARHGRPVSRAELEAVVQTSDKGRYALSPDGSRVRANQGHSVPVDLELVPTTPPNLLYHGTVAASLDPILREGLRPMHRHHVHLSADQGTARQVGARRGKPVILSIDAQRRHAAGHTFYVSENGVWLTDGVPPAFLGEVE